jgi:hypothetical protein
MGRLVIRPSLKIGLAKPPNFESKPFLLRMILFGSFIATLEPNLLYGERALLTGSLRFRRNLRGS